MSISIHVPSWGTTGSGRIHCQAAGNFNPRSLVGNDHGETSKLSQSADFNPRSLVGNDYIPVGTYTIVEISIHVPSWETTIFTRRQPPCILFQSTFPRGERQDSGQEKGGYEKDFNPRSLVGNDAGGLSGPRRSHISIHVPSWGTTCSRMESWIS